MVAHSTPNQIKVLTSLPVCRWLLYLSLLLTAVCRTADGLLGCTRHLVRWQPGRLLHWVPVHQSHAVLWLLLLLLLTIITSGWCSSEWCAAMPHIARLLVLLVLLL